MTEKDKLNAFADVPRPRTLRLNDVAIRTAIAEWQDAHDESNGAQMPSRDLCTAQLLKGEFVVKLRSVYGNLTTLRFSETLIDIMDEMVLSQLQAVYGPLPDDIETSISS